VTHGTYCHFAGLASSLLLVCREKWLSSRTCTSATGLLLWLLVPASHAHPGGLNAEGCHNNRKTGEYHCHGGGAHRSTPSTTNGASALYEAPHKGGKHSTTASGGLPPGCFVGPRGGTYTITKSGRKNYSGC
jgi:hypothetical protein